MEEKNPKALCEVNESPAKDRKQEEEEEIKLFTNYKSAGQDHVFNHLTLLSLKQRQALFAQLRKFNPHLINDQFRQCIQPQTSLVPEEKESTKNFGTLSSLSTSYRSPSLRPFNPLFDKTTWSIDDHKRYTSKGLDSIRKNQVGILLLAGGQGTRLGSLLPKGCFDIGLPNHASLFQLQAERLHSVIKQARETIVETFRTDDVEVSSTSGPKRANPDSSSRDAGNRQIGQSLVPTVSVPWYIMTSSATHLETLHFFETNHYFGLPKEDVICFQQDELPMIDAETGKFIMESPWKIATAPNGNGGLFSSLHQSGIFHSMKMERKLHYLHVFGVDNALIQVCDPAFIGFTAEQDSDCCNKVIEKKRADEKIGILCLNQENCATIVEYTELPHCVRDTRCAITNKLLFNAGNIANHCFTLTFIEAVLSKLMVETLQQSQPQPSCSIPESKDFTSRLLPYHSAIKEYKVQVPSDLEKMGDVRKVVKLEQFIFDCFAWARRPSALLVSREQEFAPVKNACGFDSPETARQLVLAQLSTK